jgi:hypothetical protein
MAIDTTHDQTAPVEARPLAPAPVRETAAAPVPAKVHGSAVAPPVFPGMTFEDLVDQIAGASSSFDLINRLSSDLGHGGLKEALGDLVRRLHRLEGHELVWLTTADVEASAASVPAGGTVGLSIAPHFEVPADWTSVVTIKGLPKEATLSNKIREELLLPGADGVYTLAPRDLEGLLLHAPEKPGTLSLAIQAHTQAPAPPKTVPPAPPAAQRPPRIDSAVETISIKVEAPVQPAVPAGPPPTVDHPAPPPAPAVVPAAQPVAG